MAPKPDKKKKPAQTSTEATQMLVVKCSRSTLEALILKSVLNAAPITLADLEATPVPSVPDSPPRGPGEATEVGSATVRFPDVNCHSCRMPRPNAPSDTMPHDS